MFAHNTFGAIFSVEAKFAGQSVSAVASDLRSDVMKAGDVSVKHTIGDGQNIILNTCSAQTPEAAGIPRSQWNGVDEMRDLFENSFNSQPSRCPGGSFVIVRLAGTP